MPIYKPSFSLQCYRNKRDACRYKGVVVKKRGGYTLVEVIVAFAIFLIVLVGISTTFVVSSKMQKRGETFVHFESICLDIDTYSDQYEREWDLHYYGEKKDAATIYYSEAYEVTSQENAKYELSYRYTTSHELIVNVKEVGSDIKIIDELNYGGRRYEEV